MRRLIVITLIIFASIAATAQTITPITQELGKRVRGEFSLANNGFTPMAVSLEIKSLKVVDGKMTLSDLDAGTHIKLSEWSARIPAKQIHSFGVDAKCDTLPCAFVVFTSMAAGHTNEGVAVTAHLGTTMYLCQKQRGCRASFIKQMKPE